MPRSPYPAIPLLLAVSAALSPALAQSDRLVLLVRHAEKAAEPAADPALTAAGEARAEALARALADAEIGTIITTQFLRTAATAAPLAATSGLTPIVVRAGGTVDEHAHAVASAVRARPAGEAVLVVGHSNTIPAIIAALGGPRLPDLCDGAYDDLFVLVVPVTGDARLVRASYGAADPPSATCLPSPSPGLPLAGVR